MRPLLFAATLALGALPVAPDPVRADCLSENIASCNADFGGTTEKIIGIRGWCYMIRTGWCALFD